MDKKTVTTISYLSRLKIDDEKEEKIIEDLDNIIKLMSKLVSGYSPSKKIVDFIYNGDLGK